ESSPGADGPSNSEKAPTESNTDDPSEPQSPADPRESPGFKPIVDENQPAGPVVDDMPQETMSLGGADGSQPIASNEGDVEPVNSGPIRGDVGLGLTIGMGLNICGPRGEASCTDLVPGPFVSAGFEYRFWRMGIGLNYAHGRHFVIGTGADEVEISTTHFTLDLLGFFPMWRTFEPFAAVGLGYGQILSEDSAQQSSVEWSSIWQTAHLRAGVRHRFPDGWALGADWFWTLYGAAYLHQGGERCVFYAAQGACRLSEELSDGQTDYATTLEMGGQIGYGF
ncbi:MAG: hypothetical protein ACPGQS_15260, partial [Bradymonadia bacterium]